MPKRCVVTGCSNTAKDGISLHLFPKDATLFRKWEKVVEMRRKNWKASLHSCICSIHFAKDQFVDDSVRIGLGFGNGKLQLKKDAVPMVNYHADGENSDGNLELFTARSAYKKRAIAQILKENKNVGNVGPDSVNVPEDMAITPPAVEVPSFIPPPPQIESRSCGTTRDKMYHKGTTVKPTMFHRRIQTSYKGPSKAVQCTPMCMSRGIQCELLMPPTTSTPEPSDSEEDMNVDDIDVDETDADYEPSDTSSDSMDDSDDDSDMDFELANQEVKFVVFRSMLMTLFALCHLCGKKGAKVATTCIGTLLIVNQSCILCGGSYRWLSQPYIGAIPAGNLLLSAAILYSGALPSKTLKVLKFWGVKAYERHCYFRHQRMYLIPAIHNIWKIKQTGLLQSARQSEVVLGGDARCDSMGHSAKYGSYTLLDLEMKKILSMELVQSNESGGSYHMELEGLKRCLAVLADMNVKVGTLVTDRHSQIQKWLRDNCEGITHYFDIWHVAKGLKKKLVALEKKKGFELISKWRRSIINHTYWSVVSSKGDGELALAKWDSITNHMVNVHSGHGDLFPTCVHKSATKKKYFTPGTECYEKLCDVLQSRYLRKDITKLSPLGQTYGVEGFHNLVNHFAPKMFHFGYAGMKGRLLLAVLHYNENAERVQARTKDGDLQYSICFPKAKQGAHTVKKVMTECTFGYVDDLIVEMMSIAEGTATGIDVVDAPPPLCVHFKHPDKQIAIANHFTRFTNVI